MLSSVRGSGCRLTGYGLAPVTSRRRPRPFALASNHYQHQHQHQMLQQQRQFQQRPKQPTQVPQQQCNKYMQPRWVMSHTRPMDLDHISNCRSPRARASLAMSLSFLDGAQVLGQLRQHARGFSTNNSTDRDDLCDEGREYKWVPPNNVHMPVEEQLEEEEEQILPHAISDQERASRRERIETWSREAAQHLDARSNLIRVKRGEHLRPDEVVSALVMNGGAQVTHIDMKDGRHAVICTARSQPQLKKLATVIYQSMKLRKLRYRLDHRPMGMTQGWAAMESGDTMIHIMSQQMRNYYQLEMALDPELEDVLYEEMSAMLLEEDKEANPKRYDIKARKHKRHFKHFPRMRANSSSKP